MSSLLIMLYVTMLKSMTPKRSMKFPLSSVFGFLAGVCKRGPFSFVFNCWGVEEAIGGMLVVGGEDWEGVVLEDVMMSTSCWYSASSRR